MAEDLTPTDEHRALASAAGALPRLRARADEIERELDDLAAEEQRARDELRRVVRAADERRAALAGERAALKGQVAAAEGADRRLRGLTPQPLREAQLAAQRARDAAAKVLRDARGALELAQLGGDQALVDELAAKAAAAEEAHAAAEQSYEAAVAQLDAAHEEVRRRLGVGAGEVQGG